MHKMLDIRPTTFLTADSVPFCSRCNGYLSVGPITILNDKPLCGRCPDKKASPASFYERLAQHMFFPCISDRFGCNTMLTWGAAKGHEKICKYSPVACPALHCLQKIKTDSIIQHFQTNHRELIVSEREFRVPFAHGEENSLVSKLVLWKDQIFVLKINFSSDCCFCSISTWFHPETGNLKYNLLLEDGEKRQSMRINALSTIKYKEKHHDKTTMTKINVNTLKTALNAKVIDCSISFEKEAVNTNFIDQSFLSDLECPICTDYMKSPIFMCSVGHSICCSCKFKVTKCPTCQVPLEDSRNFALEKVIDHILFPCKNSNKGCNFSGVISTLALHEKGCSNGSKNTTVCYVNYINKCTWTGELSEMMFHLIRKHPDAYFDLNQSLVLKLKQFNSMKSFTEYNGQIFKIHLFRNASLGLQFSVKLVKNSSLKNSKYQFHIDFRDLNKSNRILKVNGNCIVSQNDDDNLTLANSFIVHIQMLKHFIKNNTIEFRLNIVEC